MDRAKQCKMNTMTVAESSPEKAGVGSSIRILVTTQFLVISQAQVDCDFVLYAVGNPIRPSILALCRFPTTHPFLFLAGERALSFAGWNHFNGNLDSSVDPCSNHGAQERSKDKEPQLL